MLVVLTIVGIVEINYFAPAIKLYCINDGLMIIRAHAEGKVEEARRWRKHLKRENYGKQPQIQDQEVRKREGARTWRVSKHESLLSAHCCWTLFWGSFWAFAWLIYWAAGPKRGQKCVINF